MRGGSYGIGRGGAIEGDIGDRIQTGAGDGNGRPRGAIGGREANCARGGGRLTINFAAEHPGQVVGQGAEEVKAGIALDLLGGGNEAAPGAAPRRVRVGDFQGDDPNRIWVGIGNAAESGPGA